MVSNHFILATVELESIPGILGVKWEYAVDGMPVCYKLAYTNSHLGAT